MSSNGKTLKFRAAKLKGFTVMIFSAFFAVMFSKIIRGDGIHIDLKVHI